MARVFHHLTPINAAPLMLKYFKLLSGMKDCQFISSTSVDASSLALQEMARE